MAPLARDRALIGVTAVLFGISTAVTVTWCGSMASMPGMEMPGGWVMSMAWMRMPGASWAGAAATFVGMWAVMMLAMMLPVLAPMLLRYRAAPVFADAAHRHRLTGVVAIAYFSVWIVVGAAIYPLGILLAGASMRSPSLSRAAPMIFASVLLVAGALQFTRWKAHLINCCRKTPDADCVPANARGAWRHGARLGWNCVQCCAGLAASLLVLGVMDLRAMAVVSALIALERLAPVAHRWHCWVGGALVTHGAWLACNVGA